MKRFGQGFTLVEVSLFLAVSGLLFLGITVGVQNSIYQQRFNDSVQGFMEFLRGVYAEVENTQSLSGGRSEYAIYGKLVTFGEENNDKIFSYSVIGDVDKDGLGNGNVREALVRLRANVWYQDGDTIRTVGIADSYTPRWGAQIENTGDNYSRYVGTLLIVRHPASGTVYTYVMNGTALKINDAINSGRNPFGTASGNYLTDALNGGSVGFKQEQVDFCVSPNGGAEGGARRDVRIIAGARNASGVELITDASSVCGG